MTRSLTIFARLFILLILGVSLSSPALAQEEKTPFSEEAIKKHEKHRYDVFKEIQSFGWIYVYITGDVKKIGLSEAELTGYVKLRFKNNFAKTKYKAVPRKKWPYLFANDSEARKVGSLSFRVWVIGDDYPIVYHVKSEAGNFEDLQIWIGEYLGVGSKENVPDTIRKTLNQSIEELAIVFFKARGEM